MSKPIRLAILGSGNGTNAQQISEYFAGRDDVQVVSIIYNVKDAYIAQRFFPGLCARLARRIKPM